MSKVPRLTNIYSRLQEDGEGRNCTLLALEATSPFAYELYRPDPMRYEVRVKGLANMFTGPLVVQDGIIRDVAITPRATEGLVILEVRLEAPTDATVSFTEGLPSRLVIFFDRSPVKDFFYGKRVVLDPGHGGAEGGHRGPVNLWEKDVVWKTAREFSRQLESLGAEAVFTRTEGENPSWEERAEKGRGADFFISLHTHGERDRKVRGAAVLYPPGSAEMEALARSILERIVIKTRVPGRGVFPAAELGKVKGCPALAIETVTITNWVDEGVLRNPYFHRKLALAVLTGLFCAYKKER